MPPLQAYAKHYWGMFWGDMKFIAKWFVSPPETYKEAHTYAAAIFAIPATAAIYGAAMIGTGVAAALEAVGKAVFEAVVEGGRSVVETAGGVASGIGEAVGGMFDAAGDVVGGIAEAIGEVVGGVAEAVGDVIGGIIEGIGSLFGGGNDGAGSQAPEKEEHNAGSEESGDSDGGAGKPIILDLDGDGLELVALEDSSAFYDINGDGYRERMAWASPDDGFLAYDKDGDGTISAHDELSFVSYVEGARTDLEGLRHFDTNGDGQLDAGDDEWSKFRVWQDLDSDGESDSGELHTLDEAGIQSISLTSDGVERTVEGNTVFGEGSYAGENGGGTFFDVSLRHSGFGFRDEADGSMSVGEGGERQVHVAGPTSDPVRRLDATALGVIGIVGHDTADYLTAAPVGSRLHGMGGDDVLVGGEGDDWLQGDKGADWLSGGAGNDILLVDSDDFSGGAVDGGAGVDAAFIEGDTGVSADLAAHGLEYVFGSTGDDTLSMSGDSGVQIDGGGGSDAIAGGAGNDTLFGSAGDDAMEGGSGDDVLDGGAGADMLRGGAGNDEYRFGRGDGLDRLVDEHFESGAAVEAGADDSLYLSDDIGIADIVLRLRDGDLEIGLKEADEPDATFDDLSDRIAIENWADDRSKIERLIFGDGSRLDLREIVDLYGDVEEGTEVDLVAAMTAAHEEATLPGVVALRGGSGDDVLIGGSGDEVVFGGAGDDTLGGSSGNDTLEGGEGNDQYRFGRGDGLDRIRDMRETDATEGDTAEARGSSEIGSLPAGVSASFSLFRPLFWNPWDPWDPFNPFNPIDPEFPYRPIYPYDPHGLDTGDVETEQIPDGGREDSLSLQGDIGIADVLLRIRDDDLEIALKDPDNPASAFDELPDRVTLENWSSDLSRIELLTFGDGSLLDLPAIVEQVGVADGGEVVDLIDAMTDAYEGVLGNGSRAYTGTAEADILVGREGDDTISSGAGDDILFGGAGNDVLEGGAGDDHYVFGRGDGLDRVRDVGDTPESIAPESLASQDPETEESEQGDRLLLHGELGLADLVMRIRGGALEIALKDPDNPEAAFEDLADRVTVESWTDDRSKIEWLEFGDGTRLDLQGIVEACDVQEDGEAVDLLAVMRLAYPEALPGTLERNFGSTGDDALVGSPGDDVFHGGAGADDLDGGSGRDMASYTGSPEGVSVDLSGSNAGGDAEGDRYSSVEDISGSDHDDVLVGDSGANQLFGRGGDDTLRGGGGDDLLDGGRGADELDGGDGVDTASYADSAAGVVVDLAGGETSGGDAEGDQLSDIENLIGSDHADRMLGNAGTNWLFGGKGDDTLEGGSGSDYLEGGEGADDLDGGSGDDIVSYAGSDAGVTVDLSTGYVFGGDADGDTLAGFEDVVGSNHDDNLTGSNVDNYLYGGSGDDVLEGGGGSGNRLYGDDGNDTVSYASSSAGVTANLESGSATDGTLFSIENLVGSSHADRLTGDAGHNELHGGAGDDVLEGGAGSDRLYGDGGNDTASYADSAAGVSIDLAAGLASGGHAEGDALYDIENVSGSGHDDLLVGDAIVNRLSSGAGDDRLEGGDGADTLRGEGGDDTLVGGAGGDALDGGSGEDLASYAGSEAGVTVDLEAGTGTGGDAEGDTLSEIENVAGSGHADLLEGNSAANRLFGGDGDDTLRGGVGSDTLEGGAGADEIDGGGGLDIASYKSSDAGVFVDLVSGTGSGGDAEGDSLVDIIDIVGSDHADRLIGDSLSNYFYGGAGDDVLEGGASSDRLYGDDGSDTASYAGSNAGVNVNLESGTGSGGDASGDEYFSIENLSGSEHADSLTGDTGNNRISGGGGDDVLEGGSGDDVLVGGGNADRMDGGDGVDTAAYAGSSAGVTVDLETGIGSGGDADGDWLFDVENLSGSAFADTLRGNRQDNRLVGGDGNDTLVGRGGDDVLKAGAGADRIDGGDGVDIASFVGSSVGVTVNLATGAGSGGDAEGDTLAGIEDVEGSDHSDGLIGSSLDNRLYGGAGSDVLQGGGGNDTLEGGAGSDTVDGGSGRDTASYEGSSVGVRVDLASGTGSGGDAEGDTLFNVEDVVGSAFDDRLTGNAWANAISGGEGDDWLEGGAGADVIDGGGGYNVASYESSDAGVQVDLVSGTGSSGDAEGDTLVDIVDVVGSDHADRIVGDSRGNTLYGRAGDDVLVGGANGDRLYGEDGIDTASYAGSNAGVTVDLEAGTGSGGDASNDRLYGIENLTGSDHDDWLTGDAGNNRISGSAGDDVLDGGAGDDVLVGGANADIMDGGDGVDIASYANSDDGVKIDLAAGEGSGGDAEGDTLAGIENVEGSDRSDVLIGSSQDNRLFGGGGDDTLQGGDGDDTLVGGGGDDVLKGGAGADDLDGGNGVDIASYVGSSAGVTVDLATGEGSGGHAEGDALDEIENVSGSGHDDQLVGDANVNWLYGGSGDDRLEGGDGADTLRGERGDDTLVGGVGGDALYGGSGEDLASYAGSEAGVTVDLEAGTGTGGDAEGDTLSEIENVAGSGHADLLVGNSAANRLFGGDGDDTLRGGAGNDTLEGGAGADEIDGGSGYDIASYESSAAGVLVDLASGTGAGGDAEGDSLVDIIDIIGSDHGDRLIGDTQSNFFYGGAGDDVLEGGASGDRLYGDDGSDTASYAGSNAGVNVNLESGTGSGGDASGDEYFSIENLSGSEHADSLTGDTGNNRISGGGGDDVLEGGSGDDVLVGGGNADRMDGGDGVDTAAYAGSSAGVTVDLETGIGSGGDADGDRLFDVENLSGSAYADTLRGNRQDNRLVGGDGNDTLVGRGGDDILKGGAGADRIDGGDGVDIASYVGSSAGVTVNLATGEGSGGDAEGDTLAGIEDVEGSDHSDGLIGSSLDNRLYGGAGSDVLQGEGGNDTLEGGAGADTVDGGSGRDTASYEGSSVGVRVDLSSGTGSGGDAEGDTLVNVEDVVGSDFDDRLTGNAWANAISGGEGDDWLEGGAGADVIDGGGGYNVASYESSDAGVQVDLVSGTGSSGDAEGDTLVDIVDVVGSDHADRIIGDSRGNTLYGRAGDDVLVGGANGDRLYGEDGIDTASYAGSNAGVTVDLEAGTGSGGDASNDRLYGIENLTGSDHDDRLTGDSGNNRISGGAGDDVLDGGSGDDVLVGGANADIIVGGDGVDVASYAGSSAGVRIDLATGEVSGGDAEGDRLAGIEDVEGSDRSDVLIGSFQDNRLFGGGGDDTLQGGDGDDTLVGGGGDDVLKGGAGADDLDGGDGVDIASFVGSSAGVTVDLATGEGSGGDAEGDTLAGMEDIEGSDHSDVLVGSSLDNRLYGGSGSDVLQGGGGNDTLEGGAGADTVDGGSGQDTASYEGSSVGVRVDLASGTGSGGDAEGDTLVNVDNLVGSNFADRLTGNARANAIFGGEGNDWLEGGAGADVIDGGGGYDFASYESSDAGVLVDLASGTGLGGDAEGDTLVDIIDVVGSDHADRIVGNSQGNYLYGRAGDDVLEGGAGADLLFGDDGFDTASYAGSNAGVTVDLESKSGSGGDASYDQFFSIENLSGSDHDDRLTGDANGNTLSGGRGNDTLTGGQGSDVYLFGPGGGDDLIRNYGESASDDLLRLSEVSADDLWFRQSGQDLVIDLYQTDDSVTVDDWYVGEDNRLDVELDDGSRLVAADVQRLVNAMAALAPPGDGAMDYTEFQHAELDPVLAANWQVPSA